MTLYLAAIAILLLFSALFSATEIAVTMASRVRLRTRAEAGSRSAARAERLLVHPEHAIAACLVGNTLVQCAMAALGRTALMDVEGFHEAAAELVATLVLVPLVLVCGETVPKALAHTYPNRTLTRLALPLQIVRWILWPVIQVSFAIAGLVRRLAGLRPDLRDVLSREELKQFVAHSEKHGHVDRDERQLIGQIVEFWRRDPVRFARRLEALPHLSTDIEAGAAKEFMREKRLGRLVVTDSTGRDVAGVVTAVALLDAPNSAKLGTYLQPVVRFAAGVGADRVLAELQRSPSQVGVQAGSGDTGRVVYLLDDLLQQLLGGPGVPRHKNA
jgi:putative hemolysin